MKKFFWILLIMFICFFPSMEASAASMPCSLVLEPVDNSLPNAKGTALVYKVQLNPPSFARTNITIVAAHLPSPSSFGDYDMYEGYAFIPKEISWRFNLYPTKEDPSPTWAGKFDLITAEMDKAEIQVRVSHSKTKKLGPAVLNGVFQQCK